MNGHPAPTNALARETSPYLLQHAHNPVDWHPWGPAAFTLARQAGKPIFISIGYSTCYWCHVMERQCFEVPRIAALMNDNFINIKVDREERPDVDGLYMTAVQIMTGSGGWPMSVFLTPPGAKSPDDPGLRPFYAGTYFPPEPAHGLPSFPQVLSSLSDAWLSRRQEVLDQAQQITAALRQYLAQSPPPTAPDPELVRDAANQLANTYDPEHGGFGAAPKFPQAANLLFLIALQRHNPSPRLAQAVAHTLSAMARGGIFDQVGGGFHRYATDSRWLVPHFEKMLYDTALLVDCYLAARAAAPDADDPLLYERLVRTSCAFVLRELTDPSGAFWSAQDAEVGAREGGNYLWNSPEITAALGSDLADLVPLALQMYGLSAGPNFRDPHHPAAPPANVLFLPASLPELARQRHATLDQVLALKARIDQRLLMVRLRRPQPAVDDKVLTAWNGMMIAALARAGRELPEPSYTTAAAAAARAILKHMADPAGNLSHSMCRGSVKVRAFLDDYAFFIHGLIELHRSDPQGPWLAAAERFAAVVERDFALASGDVGAGGGGYYDTLADQPDLLLRPRSLQDGAIPSGNSQMVHDLLDLHQLTQKQEYLDRAVHHLHAAAPVMRQHGVAMVHMTHALLRALEIAPERLRATPAPAAAGASPSVTATVQPTACIPAPGGRTRATVLLQVRPGYHISAPGPGAAGLSPTHIELRAGPGSAAGSEAGLELSVDYPPPLTRKFAFADRALQVYEGAVAIAVTLHALRGTPPPAAAELIVTCQACTDRSCLEPTTISLPITG